MVTISSRVFLLAFFSLCIEESSFSGTVFPKFTLREERLWFGGSPGQTFTEIITWAPSAYRQDFKPARLEPYFGRQCLEVLVWKYGLSKGDCELYWKKNKKQKTTRRLQGVKGKCLPGWVFQGAGTKNLASIAGFALNRWPQKCHAHRRGFPKGQNLALFLLACGVYNSRGAVF